VIAFFSIIQFVFFFSLSFFSLSKKKFFCFVQFGFFFSFFAVCVFFFLFFFLFSSLSSLVH
jgi:hypothetical protein